VAPTQKHWTTIGHRHHPSRKSMRSRMQYVIRSLLRRTRRIYWAWIGFI